MWERAEIKLKPAMRALKRWLFREEAKKKARTKKQLEYQSDIILENGVYYTSNKLLDKGMGLCPECGWLLSIDNKYCKNCEDDVVFLRYKYKTN